MEFWHGVDVKIFYSTANNILDGLVLMLLSFND